MNEIKEIRVGDFVTVTGCVGTYTVLESNWQTLKLVANYYPFAKSTEYIRHCKLADHQPPKQNIDSQIEEIINNFDFEKVHKVMKLLKWQWFSSNTEDKVPSYGELIQQSKSLLTMSVKGLNEHKGNYYSTGTGGFNAVAIRCEDDYIVVELQFNIAEGSNRE